MNLLIKIESCLKLWAGPREGTCLAARGSPPARAGRGRARGWEARGHLIAQLGPQPCGQTGVSVCQPAQPAPTCPLQECTMGCGTRDRLRREWEWLQWKTMVGVSLAAVWCAREGIWGGGASSAAGRGLIWRGAAAAVLGDSQGWERCSRVFAGFFAELCPLCALSLVTLLQLRVVLLGHLWLHPLEIWCLHHGDGASNPAHLAQALEKGHSVPSHVPVASSATLTHGILRGCEEQTQLCDGV